MPHFDAIFFYDSHFQKLVVEYLIKEKYSEKSCLVIDAIGGKYSWADNTVHLGFNTLKQSLSSLKNIRKFPKNLSCDEIVGSWLTGNNSNFLLSSIQYKKIVLIDDGIGTPVILKVGDIFKLVDYKYKLNFLLLRILFLISGKKQPLRNPKIIACVAKYWSLYQGEVSLNKERITPFNTDFEIVKGQKAFIGQPFIDYGMMDKESYLETLNNIRGGSTLRYFPDPSEKWYLGQNIDGLDIAEKGEPLEVRLQKEGMPEEIYTFVSSAILNLKTIFPATNGFFVRMPNAKKFRNYYYEVLADNGIQEFK